MAQHVTSIRLQIATMEVVLTPMLAAFVVVQAQCQDVRIILLVTTTLQPIATTDHVNIPHALAQETSTEMVL